MADNMARVSAAELLHAVEQLPPVELDEFVKNVISFQAHRKAKGLPATETEFLQHINKPLPTTLLNRYRELIALRREERLTEEEYTELLRTGDEMERFNSERLKWLAELAQLRGVSLRKVIDDLGIHPLAV
jgi:hypothetical protein